MIQFRLLLIHHVSLAGQLVCRDPGDRPVKRLNFMLFDLLIIEIFHLLQTRKLGVLPNGEFINPDLATSRLKLLLNILKLGLKSGLLHSVEVLLHPAAIRPDRLR